MDALIFAAVLVALAVYVARPLYATSPHPQQVADTEADASRRAVSEALDDLDMDRATGLVDHEAYGRQRAELEAGGGRGRPTSDERTSPGGGPSAD